MTNSQWDPLKPMREVSSFNYLVELSKFLGFRHLKECLYIDQVELFYLKLFCEYALLVEIF